MSRTHGSHADDNGEHVEPVAELPPAPEPKAELSVEDRLTALEATVARIAPLIGE